MTAYSMHHTACTQCINPSTCNTTPYLHHAHTHSCIRKYPQQKVPSHSALHNHDTQRAKQACKLAAYDLKAQPVAQDPKPLSELVQPIRFELARLLAAAASRWFAPSWRITGQAIRLTSTSVCLKCKKREKEVQTGELRFHEYYEYKR